jgi:hypothetical protein
MIYISIYSGVGVLCFLYYRHQNVLVVLRCPCQSLCFITESGRQIEKLNVEKDMLKKTVKQLRRDSEHYYQNDKECKCYPRKDKDHHIEHK